MTQLTTNNTTGKTSRGLCIYSSYGGYEYDYVLCMTILLPGIFYPTRYFLGLPPVRLVSSQSPFDITFTLSSSYIVHDRFFPGQRGMQMDHRPHRYDTTACSSQCGWLCRRKLCGLSFFCSSSASESDVKKSYGWPLLIIPQPYFPRLKNRAVRLLHKS